MLQHPEKASPEPSVSAEVARAICKAPGTKTQESVFEHFILVFSNSLNQDKEFKTNCLKTNCIAIQTGTFPLPGHGFNKHTRLMPELTEDNL